MEQLRSVQQHSFTPAEFARIAGAQPVPDLVEPLRAARLSRSLLLLSYVLRTTPGLQRARVLLAEAHEADRGAVNELLVSPWTVARIVAAVREPGDPRHQRRVAALSLAAAARAGLAGPGIEVVPEDGRVAVPTLGGLDLPEPSRVSAADLRGPGWQPIRSLTADHTGLRVSVQLDDVDPYRDIHAVPALTRLAPARVEALDRIFDGACGLLATYAPGRLGELAAGLRSIVLLDGEGRQSATNEEAFGGLATTMPNDSLQLLVVLVHEFHHSKLAAVDSLARLTRSRHPGRYFAPWRREMRPLLSLLHGIFAFTAVAMLFWDLSAGSRLRDVALPEFALVRAQVRAALAGLSPADPGLTAAGRLLVTELAGSTAELDRLPVPPAVAAEAEARVAEARRALDRSP